ncbi:hypothetical protein M5K25_021307 [Dendrobium thyrsiflorum]|uniref:Uncharacterized protein n=1 Tax=Dendrobium thyrsiflorum TaxID=117978 RepID=A0ABD0UC02_DENTH
MRAFSKRGGKGTRCDTYDENGDKYKTAHFQQAIELDSSLEEFTPEAQWTKSQWKPGRMEERSDKMNSSFLEK